MGYVFISYIHENEKIVKQLYNSLTSHRIAVWLSRNKIKPGYRWKQEIRKAISESSFFIACFSNEYSERDITYMNEELTIAIEELRKHNRNRAWFIPVKLTECDIPDWDIGSGETLQDLQWVEIYKNWGHGVRRILLSIGILDATCVDKTEDKDCLSMTAVCQYEYEQSKYLEIIDKSVSIRKTYQMLPLMREVKSEHLPKEGANGKEQDEELRDQLKLREDKPKLRLLSYFRQWEEEMNYGSITYQPYTLEELFTDFGKIGKKSNTQVPRFIVLGPPGSGKSTLIQYLTFIAANQDDKLNAPTDRQQKLYSILRGLVPARVRLREWEAWAVKPSAPNQSLPEYLAERYKDLRLAPTADQWRRWLHLGNVLLLLDGLDEVAGDPSFLNTLRSAFDNFRDCPTILTCRTVSFEQHQSLSTDFPVFLISGLKEERLVAC